MVRVRVRGKRRGRKVSINAMFKEVLEVRVRVRTRVRDKGVRATRCCRNEFEVKGKSESKD